MGCYVNLVQPKLSWLEMNALPVDDEEAERMVENGELFGAHDDVLLCYVQNIMFDAIAICYNTREFEAFTDPHDRRPRQFWLASREDVARVCPDLDRYLPQ